MWLKGLLKALSKSLVLTIGPKIAGAIIFPLIPLGGGGEALVKPTHHDQLFVFFSMRQTQITCII